MKITIETTVNAPLERVWNSWVSPGDIKNWNFAIDEWCCPDAKLDFQVGGNFSYRMEAKDGSVGFDFEGEFTNIEENKIIEFKLEDERKVKVCFSETEQGVLVSEIFEAEDENSADQQKQGWQNILNNFKRYVESKNN